MEEYLLPLHTPCVYYDANFLSESEASVAYQYLLTNTPWEKTPKINRWVTLMELPPKAKGGGEDDANAEGDAKMRQGASVSQRSGRVHHCTGDCRPMRLHT